MKKSQECAIQYVLPTNLADELSELVQVTLSLWGDAQLSDAAVKLLRPLKRILERTAAGVFSKSSEVEFFTRCSELGRPSDPTGLWSP